MAAGADIFAGLQCPALLCCLTASLHAVTDRLSDQTLPQLRSSTGPAQRCHSTPADCIAVCLLQGCAHKQCPAFRRIRPPSQAIWSWQVCAPAEALTEALPVMSLSFTSLESTSNSNPKTACSGGTWLLTAWLRADTCSCSPLGRLLCPACSLLPVLAFKLGQRCAWLQMAHCAAHDCSVLPYVCTMPPCRAARPLSDSSQALRSLDCDTLLSAIQQGRQAPDLQQPGAAPRRCCWQGRRELSAA